MVTAKKGILSEDLSSEAKSGFIRSAVRARASVPERAHVLPVTAGGMGGWRLLLGGAGWEGEEKGCK